jgi:hypothetical protein
MLAKLSKCFRCGSAELELKIFEELVRRGPYVVALPLQAEVCANCGERYLQRQDVVAIEAIRRRLERGELAGFRVMGELLEPRAAGR